MHALLSTSVHSTEDARSGARRRQPRLIFDFFDGGAGRETALAHNRSAFDPIKLDPKVLVAAQPTWGVDVGAAAAIHQRFLDLRADGAALLLISEEMEELLAICDRIQVMFRGRLSPAIAAGDTDVERIGLAMTGDLEGLAHA